MIHMMIIMILNDNNGSVIPSIFVFSPFLFVENASCPLFFLLYYISGIHLRYELFYESQFVYSALNIVCSYT